MTVTLRKPDSKEYKVFSEHVKLRAELQYGNFTYGEEEVCTILMSFSNITYIYKCHHFSKRLILFPTFYINTNTDSIAFSITCSIILCSRYVIQEEHIKVVILNSNNSEMIWHYDRAIKYTMCFKTNRFPSKESWNA